MPISMNVGIGWCVVGKDPPVRVYTMFFDYKQFLDSQDGGESEETQSQFIHFVVDEKLRAET